MNTSSSIIPTHYWKPLTEGRIQCTLCPRACQIKEGDTGLCFVRANQDQRMVLTTYGRSSGFCVDPIEKKPLYHFLPGTEILSFGTAGCNLTCKFCQNWDISKSRKMDRLAEHATPEMIARSAKSLNCRGVAYTYNEPIIFHEYAIDVAKACRQVGLKSVAVTAGYICDAPRQEFFSVMDAANVDLKAFTEKFYVTMTGGHLQPVLETLRYLKHETNVWLELTTLLISGENDSEKEIEGMTQWVVENLGSDVPMHFTAFHPAWKMLNHVHTSAHTLSRARDIALKNGVHYAYTGNVSDPHGGSTYCHHCGHVLIGRSQYLIEERHISEDGKCHVCGTQCAGLFE